MKQTTISDSTKRLTGIAMFSAFAFCMSLVTNIKIQHLTFDAKDAVITVASFIYGPGAAAIMSFITAFLEFITIGTTGIWGMVMDFISTASFTVTASLIYKYRRRLSGAIIALVSAALVYVPVMLVANLFITPLYSGVGADIVKQMIPTLLLPFNIAKALMNSALVMLIYKPISNLMKRIGFSGGSSDKTAKSGSRRDTFIMLAIATGVFIIALIMFIILMK